MSDERVRAALRELAGSAPVHADVTAVIHRPNPPRPRLVPVLAAVAVVLVIVSVILFRLPGGPQTADSSGRPSLPDRFPGYSVVQGRTDGQFGRAIALYTNGIGNEDWGFWQVIVAGADRDQYRRIDLPPSTTTVHVRAILSPDGTRVAMGGDDLMLLDLVTGARTVYPVRAHAGIVPLAFSPDGRYVAFIDVTDPIVVMGPGPLSILDTSTRTATVIDSGDADSAAFSPDGTRVAYRLTEAQSADVFISGRDGTGKQKVSFPPGAVLAGAQAWSPDGSTLVGVQYDAPSYVFVSLDGSNTPRIMPAGGLIPRAGGDAVIGWRSPTTMLVSTGDVDGTTSNLIAAVNVTDGSHDVISRFTVGKRDDLAVLDVQLAAALVAEADIRHSTSPDRGTWPGWAIITGSLCLVIVALPVLLWIRRIRQTVHHGASGSGP